MAKQNIVKIPTKFPVHIDMKGDDFNFECEISMEMAGKIIEYMGEQRERKVNLSK